MLNPDIRILRRILAIATVIGVLAVIAAGPGGAVVSEKRSDAAARYEPPDPCRTVRDRRAHARCVQSHARAGAEKPEYTRYKR
jgi:hypothetical protein